MTSLYNCLNTPRVCSTKTRIKTYCYYFNVVRLVLREYVPLKQGLRLPSLGKVSWDSTPRVCSTKTRIKTPTRAVNGVPADSPRVCSTKTRIKTPAHTGF